jgi:hypothetical protein
MNSLVSAEERWRLKLPRIITGLPMLSLTLVDRIFLGIPAYARSQRATLITQRYFSIEQ